MPRVIRPDLILTAKDGDEKGNSFALTELDSVPGGMGITLWLSRFYSEHGFDILGGANGIRDGFQNLYPEQGGRVLVSDESDDYRPEMTWLAEQCENISIHRAETHDPTDNEENIYRFFEWFDWQNIPARQKACSITSFNIPMQTPPGGKALAGAALVTLPAEAFGKKNSAVTTSNDCARLRPLAGSSTPRHCPLRLPYPASTCTLGTK